MRLFEDGAHDFQGRTRRPRKVARPAPNIPARPLVRPDFGSQRAWLSKSRTQAAKVAHTLDGGRLRRQYVQLLVEARTTLPVTRAPFEARLSQAAIEPRTGSVRDFQSRLRHHPKLPALTTNLGFRRRRA